MIQSIHFGIHVLLMFVFFASPALCQVHPNSPVLKSYVPADSHSLVTPRDLNYELWQEFLLVKKANQGDPIAEHELGIRYILGKGFSSDTVKAAYWITKAAEQDLPSARYNLGILQNNGWAVAWNPFEAFRNIGFAASRGMPEAEYLLGLFYLDNLVVPRDEREAYCFVSAAADSHYIPAEEALIVFEQRGLGKRKTKDQEESKTSSRDSSTVSSASRVMFLDFDRDTSTQVPDTALIRELVRDGSVELQAMNDTSRSPEDSASIVRLVRQAAEAGSPEALTILGRWYELGSHVDHDIITASEYYVRATLFDSPRSPALLWNLIHDQKYFEMLKHRVDRHDAGAEVVWASLVALQFDNQLTQQQAISMLESAANENNIQALIELGSWYVQGNLVQKDRLHGITLWDKAKSLGSREAEIRIAVTELMSLQDSAKTTQIVSVLSDAMNDGSVLAQVAMGYCREHGLGFQRNVGEAVKLYRKSAERGSLAGFEALKRMYDALRPPDREFRIDE
jgi:TPR repeat protein